VLVLPPKPPVEPVYANAAPKAFQMSEAVRRHAAVWRAYHLMRKTEISIRNQLLVAANGVYWRRMRLPTLGYAIRTICELLTHMLTIYGHFTDAEQQAVASPIEIPWEGGPLEIVIQQIEDAADTFQLGGAEMTDPPKRDKVYDLVNSRTTS
jgi:hypothetical protein